EDADRARARVVEMADQRKQGRLAGAVEAEQHGEGRGRQREGDVVQRLAAAIKMAHRSDLERRDAGWHLTAGWLVMQLACSFLPRHAPRIAGPRRTRTLLLQMRHC